MLGLAAGLGVAPEAFWRLSLKEWWMLTQTARGTAPL
ncbi:phage tail assembly chaperone, partial [Brevundimonas sp.]